MIVKLNLTLKHQIFNTLARQTAALFFHFFRDIDARSAKSNIKVIKKFHHILYDD
jgi:hypothetical protein